MSARRTQAIVLRRTNYGEADRVLQILTPEGKKGVIAKGARREKSKLAGGIELFALSDVVITEGRGELGILTSARVIEFYRHILDDYDTMQFAYEVIKHIGRASETVDEPEWFDMLLEVLAVLNNINIPRQLTETWFFLRYAQLLGDELNLRGDTEGKSLQEDARYTYDVSDKGLRYDQKGGITGEHVKFLRLASVKPIAILAHIGGLEPILPACYMAARQHAAI